jgi:tetratricopeptide (TPR) repeat protein
MKEWFTNRSVFIVILIVCCTWALCPAEDNVLHARIESSVSDYQNGEYRKAADSLQAILPSLKVPEDLMEAYKYLGFSYGMLNLIDKSKMLFKTALEKYPAMDIDTLEVPPNIAIIFNQAKLEKKIEKIDASIKENPPKATASDRVNQPIVEKKSVVAPVLLLSAAIVSAGAGGNLFYYGSQQYQKYASLDVPDQNVLDGYYARYRNSFIAGAGCAGLAAVLLPISIYLFVKKDHPQKGIAVSYANGWPSLVYRF